VADHSPHDASLMEKIASILQEHLLAAGVGNACPKPKS
jgi:hypothetical protein